MQRAPSDSDGKENRAPGADSTTSDLNAASSGPAPSDAPARDVALLHSATPDGSGVNIVRLREDTVEVGALRPLEEGKPIQGEVVRLKPREEQPRVCDVEVMMPAPDKQRSRPAAAVAGEARSGQRKGPAQVATDRYRANWDRIWQTSRKSGGELN